MRTHRAGSSPARGTTQGEHVLKASSIDDGLAASQHWNDAANGRANGRKGAWGHRLSALVWYGASSPPLLRRDCHRGTTRRVASEFESVEACGNADVLRRGMGEDPALEGAEEEPRGGRQVERSTTLRLASPSPRCPAGLYSGVPRRHDRWGINNTAR